MKKLTLILFLLFTLIASAVGQENPSLPLPEYIVEVQRPDGCVFCNRRHLERVIESFRFYAEADPAEMISQLNYL